MGVWAARRAKSKDELTILSLSKNRAAERLTQNGKIGLKIICYQIQSLYSLQEDCTIGH
jgi:hypothetical protein